MFHNGSAGRQKVDERTLAEKLVSLIRRPSEITSPEVRADIETEVLENIGLTLPYFLLLFCSCGIATLGLLQSSVAVVIGAMLISPLMGPIMAMGLTLARFEFSQFNRAAVSLAIGAAVSVLAAMIIVWISPLKDITPEILARTRPTLLDLVVAALSGIVAAFVTMARKGGVIAGVAIATALMPPLAVVGFGLATGSWTTAGGAFLLFVTNVVAILIAVLLVARRYGFVPAHEGHRPWETATIIAILLALCVPLFLSLRDIVSETRLTNQVRADINAMFRPHQSRITDLRVLVTHGRLESIQAVVVTKGYVANASTLLKRKYGMVGEINLEQVLAANEQTLIAGLRTAASPATPVNGLEHNEAFLRSVLSRRANIERFVASDGQTRAHIRLKSNGTLKDYRDIEAAVRQLMPDSKVLIVPPVEQIPAIAFRPGQSAIDENGAQALEIAGWALQRWGLTHVEVIGSAPSNRPTLARQRASAVAERLGATGLTDISTASSISQASESTLDEVHFIATAPSPVVPVKPSSTTE